MYLSAGHAVKSMLRWRERQRSPRAAPWPDHAPGAASAANPWRYIHINETRPSARPEPDDDRDPHMVSILFDRHDKRRALTRLFIDGDSIQDFKSTEQRRARRCRNRFIRELCCRGLLEFQGENKAPQKNCIPYVRNECSRFPRGSKGGG